MEDLEVQVNKYKRFYGVDPGKSPAICVLDNKGDIIFISQLKKRDGFPNKDYCNLFLGFDTKDCIVTCENPHSVFGASAKANFMFGLSVGSCIQGATVDGVEPILVVPKLWQRSVISPKDLVTVKGKRDTKATALKACKRILGSKWDIKTFLPTQRSSVPSHDMVDAYLIAYYCFLKNNK